MTDFNDQNINIFTWNEYILLCSVKLLLQTNVYTIGWKMYNNGFNDHFLSYLVETDAFLISRYNYIYPQNLVEIAWKLQNNGFLTDIS